MFKISYQMFDLKSYEIYHFLVLIHSIIINSITKQDRANGRVVLFAAKCREVSSCLVLAFMSAPASNYKRKTNMKSQGEDSESKVSLL